MKFDWVLVMEPLTSFTFRDYAPSKSIFVSGGKTPTSSKFIFRFFGLRDFNFSPKAQLCRGYQTPILERGDLKGQLCGGGGKNDAPCSGCSDVVLWQVWTRKGFMCQCHQNRPAGVHISKYIFAKRMNSIL